VILPTTLIVALPKILPVTLTVAEVLPSVTTVLPVDNTSGNVALVLPLTPDCNVTLLLANARNDTKAVLLGSELANTVKLAPRVPVLLALGTA
jgi:hypothetical protein